MNRFSVTQKTMVASFLLFLVFVSFSAIFMTNVFQSTAQSSARSILRSNLASLADGIKSMSNAEDASFVDYLPPGYLALVVSPSGKTYLNSFLIMPSEEFNELKNIPVDTLVSFKTMSNRYWALRSIVPGPGGNWFVEVSQHNQIETIFTKSIIRLIIFLALLFLLFVVLSSWLLSRYVLSPVRSMRERTQEMIRRKRREDLPVPRARDEIQFLGNTLNELHRLLYSSLESQNRLIADASHELRTPLAVLQTRLQLLMTDPSSRPIRNDLADLLNDSRKLSNLTDKLLYMASRESRNIADCVSPQEAEEIVTSSIDDARILGSIKMIEIIYDLDIRERITVDSEGFERILLNLLSNAIIASPESGAIHVSIYSYESSAILTIDDQGEGFDEAFIPIAFERFSRFDKSRSRDTGGSGLGLALVKSILDFYGGSITLSNRLEGGSRVEVRFVSAPE